MSEPNYLLEAIERLTLPHTSKVPQQNEAGISCMSEVRHDSLLKLLKGAIGGNVGRHQNAQQAREKIPLNPAALEKFDEIAHRVDKWLKEILPDVAPRHEELWSALGRCYLQADNLHRANRVGPGWYALFSKTVIGWVREIENMFDPPNVFEITRVVDDHDVPEACPICAESYALDPKTGNRVTAVVVEYRNLGHETLSLATGHCRFCGTVWPGSHGVRELRWLLDQQQHQLEAVSA